jgi:hypothetical protein
MKNKLFKVHTKSQISAEKLATHPSIINYLKVLK